MKSQSEIIKILDRLSEDCFKRQRETQDKSDGFYYYGGGIDFLNILKGEIEESK